MAGAIAQAERIAMKTLSLTLTADDLAMIEQIRGRLSLATRHAIARAAFRTGLDQMSRDEGYAFDCLVRETEKRRTAA
jgi:hypothetical protein